MNIKANKKNILVGIIVVIIIGIIGIVCYDRITVNNQYYIGEKNLEIPIFVYHNIVNDSSEIKYDYISDENESKRVLCYRDDKLYQF